MFWRSSPGCLGCLGLIVLVALEPASVLVFASDRPTIVVPRVSQPPKLEEFLEMNPGKPIETQLAKIEGFVQRAPRNGEPSSQPTEVYLGYDDKNLYSIFVCFDSAPEKIRGHLSRRENIGSDDTVGVILDTFNDQRRAYAFSANPLGIQADSIQTEGQAVDLSFDTLWYSQGRRTQWGYVVWIAIPFKSLRFPATREQIWRVIFNRDIPRNNEETYWPHISSRIEGRLNQAATLRGLENVSPGRNIQLIPYGIFRSFRALDVLDPLSPRFVRDRADPGAGIDAKFVFKDSLVFDLALNPDFSQVESDEPQVTVNQRFEVFFPEKRPFFTENAGFFQTPINLLFTRRIADPQFGVRLTGKLRQYAIGVLLAHDQAPGKRAPKNDPLHGNRALFSIVRINRDVFRQSTLGLIYTDHEFLDSFNRVGGLDARLKLSQNWVADFQGATSWTRLLDGSRLAGPAYIAELLRSGRKFNYSLTYDDRSVGFRTQPGFLLRSDIRRFGQSLTYRFRPEGRRLISWGPSFSVNTVWDHNSTRLDQDFESSVSWEFSRQTFFQLIYNTGRERLRPVDFPVLTENRDFSRNVKGLLFSTSFVPQVTFEAFYGSGTRINLVPLQGQEPVLANRTSARVNLVLRPSTSLQINNTYMLSRLGDRASAASIFNNHIIRSKWNWQLSRELSLRVILQYSAVLANQSLTVLQTTKNFNADIQFTCLVHPGTALYVGYNSNLQNLDPALISTNGGFIRTRNSFINDAKQLYVKFSYLFRF